MNKKKIEVAIQRLESQNEFYNLTIKTYDQKIEAKIDKENARHIIQIIDNEIL